jgi:hypothetical protein
MKVYYASRIETTSIRTITKLFDLKRNKISNIKFLKRYKFLKELLSNIYIEGKYEIT